ncbi:hypothetical protein [Coprobacter tertius]|uniref:Alpha-L-rhamnosidase six-hairpin glycosidase domain-containing protein n=1 Tax=Coprobacter tertius TaxID=2944915 RepID=A0ABT1MF66_9BACT|nr:hypothetical protein [Coprobacter tertius]MCP9610704.1 hypothetical protein [Coprobacter tertius]
MKHTQSAVSLKFFLHSSFFLIFISVIILCAFSNLPLQAITHDYTNNTKNSRSTIKHESDAGIIRISDTSRNLELVIDYSTGCKITQLNIKGINTLSESGIYTGFTTKNEIYNSCVLDKKINVINIPEGIRLEGITFGNDTIQVDETWNFVLHNEKIIWNIQRKYNKTTELEEIEFPRWNFADLSIWKGGIFDNGGMVWCKYLSGINDTYGVHTGGVTLWNPQSGNGLKIAAQPGNNSFIASKYSLSDKKEFVCTHLVTDKELKQRYNLNRFVRGKADVFSPFSVKTKNSEINLELQYIDYTAIYSRGVLPGIDSEAVRELMNTTGRYGVVDNGIIGANGWTTNWKCLHEPFFAQIGMALNDKNYTRNFCATLDRERDYAITEEGRVLSRWHNDDSDQMPGTYDYETGYYEARWGYTIDSQTGYIINTAEQFDLCGDIDWLRSHKKSCEKALDWLIARDSNHNGIFEMMNNSIDEQTASDWLDIVWASFENAFVNAQMYEALKLWADCESILGDQQKSAYYKSVAKRLKSAFNKPVDQGGFWSPDKNQYVYWRDKDGSIHGDNLVTPVNFAAIAFGICDNQDRISRILDQIESRTSEENLFHWPLCFDSYKREEVSNRNWPFPTYENGDIFPTWGYLGIRAYVAYNKNIGLKYIRNILDQYKKDGLSSQRYSRKTQQGQGSDILAGICTSVTALYRDIYGIRPKWNRMGLEPNLTKELNGTSFAYTHLGTEYRIELKEGDYRIGTENFSVRSSRNFGIFPNGKELIFYPENKESMALILNARENRKINLHILDWNPDYYTWSTNGTGKCEFELRGLLPGNKYRISINGNNKILKAGKKGNIRFKVNEKSDTTYRIEKI